MSPLTGSAETSRGRRASQARTTSPTLPIDAVAGATRQARIARAPSQRLRTTSAAGVAGAISPVPGGTGPVTNAILLRHVLDAARRQTGGA